MRAYKISLFIDLNVEKNLRKVKHSLTLKDVGFRIETQWIRRAAHPYDGNSPRIQERSFKCGDTLKLR
jgi:hypothetical protein